MNTALLTTYAQGTISGPELIVICAFVLLVLGGTVALVLAISRRHRRRR